MPACCIVKCGARKNEKRAQLSLHRFPKNEALKKKWLEAIGEENINPRHKDWHICSLHFEERCFNRTLDVIRLRDNSVPTIFPASDDLGKSNNIKKTKVSCSSTEMSPLQLPHRCMETVHKEDFKTRKIKSLKEKYVKQQQIIRRLKEIIQRKKQTNC